MPRAGIVGVTPDTSPFSSGAATVRGGVVVALAVHLALVCMTALKGKYPTTLLGIFLSPLAWVAAVRLARPRSPWGRRFYSAQGSPGGRARDDVR